MRQLRHSYHCKMLESSCGFNVADSAFYNVHMITLSHACRTSSGVYPCSMIHCWSLTPLGVMLDLMLGLRPLELSTASCLQLVSGLGRQTR